VTGQEIRFTHVKNRHPGLKSNNALALALAGGPSIYTREDVMHSIQTLEPSRYAEVIPFVCREFVEGSVLHQALGVRVEDYTTYLTEPIRTIAGEGFSLIATNSKSNAIEGCILAGEFAPSSSGNNPPPAYLAPVRALTDVLEHAYRERRDVTPGSTLLVDIAVVAKSARRLGVYKRLREAVQARARDRGYQRVIGELSSPVTQHMCVKQWGHTIEWEIVLGTFEFNGMYPFANISSPNSIQLVETTLA
jgi:GNAT superfamily N-acetyltransferase